MWVYKLGTLTVTMKQQERLNTIPQGFELTSSSLLANYFTSCATDRISTELFYPFKLFLVTVNSTRFVYSETTIFEINQNFPNLKDASC